MLSDEEMTTLVSRRDRLDARYALRNLRQTGSALSYFRKFQQYVYILGWTDQEILIEAAFDGLKDHVRDALVHVDVTEFKTLGDLIKRVVPLDDYLYQREQEKKREREEEKQQLEETRRREIHVNNLHASSSSTVSRTAIDMGLEEQRRTLDNKQCFLCGELGHINKYCPRKRR